MVACWEPDESGILRRSTRGEQEVTDKDLMLERLRKRDQLILELKEALLQREKQVNELELVLAHWPADHPRPASDSLVSAEPSAPAAVGPRRIQSKPLESSREPVHAL